MIYANAVHMRETVVAMNAMDAPFYSLQRERALAKQGVKIGDGAAARSAAATGLVLIENKGPAHEFPVPVRLRRRGAVLIDGHARRMKRLRGVVEHSLRLAETQLAHRGGFRFKRLLVTLTYREVDGWAAGDLGAYVRIARKWALKKGFSLKWTWVAELQGRGAVHYHICMWIPVRHRLPEADLFGWWKHGSTNVTKVHGGCSGVMAYLGKYLTKGGSKQSLEFPKGLRMYGAGGLDVEHRREMRYRLAPFWVRDAMGTYADIRRTLGGWVDRFTGLFIASPWKIEICGSGFVWAYKPAV